MGTQQKGLIARLGKSPCLILIFILAAVVNAGSAGAEAEQSTPLAVLLEVVQDPEDIRYRQRRIQYLVKDLGAQVEPAFSALHDLLEDPQDHTRAGAALGLGSFGHNAIGAIPDLVGLLGDGAWQVRYAAAWALGLLESLARPSVPSLIELLADPVEAVGTSAGLALARIQIDLPVAAASDFVTQLGNDTPDERLSAIASLGRLESGQTAFHLGLAEGIHGIAAPALHTMLRDGDEAERAAAVIALRQIAKHHHLGHTKDLERRRPPASTILALTGALDDGAAAIRIAAADALAEVSMDVDAVAPALTAAFRDSNREVRAAAAKALGLLGWLRVERTPGIAGAVPGLIELGKDPDSGVRAAAVFALGRMRIIHPEIVPAMVQALGDEDAGVREAAAFGLFHVGEIIYSYDGSPKEFPPEHLNSLRRAEARRAIPQLIETLADSEKDVRRAAARAILEIGPNTDAIPALLRALEDNFVSVQRLAAFALGKVEPSTDQIVTALIDTLHDDHSSVREAAASALGTIGPAAEAAVPAVRALLSDTDEGVQRTARQALDLIVTP